MLKNADDDINDGINIEKNNTSINESNTTDTGEIKIPKKRGRKARIKTQEELEQIKIPKKRGRKPKIKIENEENVNKFVLPSKRGRKPKEKSYNLSSNNLVNNIDNLFILHLPLPYDKVKSLLIDEPYSYNPNLDLPIAFDPYTINENLLDSESINEDNNLYSFKNSDNNLIETDNINTKLLNENNDNIDDNFSTNMLMKFSEYSKKYKNLPDETTNKCYWCLHGFENKVYGLPLKISDDKFEMYGCFCSPQCVVAFNFNDLDDEFVWERYSYINYLYNNDITEKIYPAPSRLVLTIFGGELSIEQFRNITEKKYNGNILLPPLISIIPQLEVYKSNFSGNNVNSMTFNNKIDKFNTLKLKRDKPLINKKNNLETTLKLVYI